MISTRLSILGSVGFGLILVVWTAERSPARAQRHSSGRHVQLKEFDMRRSVELQVLGDTEVRISKPPPQVDSAGKPKKYTDRELRELKGNPRLPGYEGAFADLKLGQTVKVYVGLRKTSSKKAPGGKTSTDPEDKVSWKRLGYLKGIVVMIDHEDAISKKRRKKKTDDLFSPDAAARFTIQVESLLVSSSRGSGSQTATNKRPAILGKNVFATRVVILRDVKPEDDDK